MAQDISIIQNTQSFEAKLKKAQSSSKNSLYKKENAGPAALINFALEKIHDHANPNRVEEKQQKNEVTTPFRNQLDSLIEAPTQAHPERLRLKSHKLHKSIQKAASLVDNESRESKLSASPYHGMFNINVQKIQQQKSNDSLERRQLNRFVAYQPKNTTEYESQKKHELMMQKLKEAEKYYVGGVLRTDQGTIIYNLNRGQKAKMIFPAVLSQDSFEDPTAFEDFSNLPFDSASIEQDQSSSIKMLDYFNGHEHDQEAQQGRKSVLMKSSTGLLGSESITTNSILVPSRKLKNQTSLSTLESRTKPANKHGARSFKSKSKLRLTENAQSITKDWTQKGPKELKPNPQEIEAEEKRKEELQQ